VLRFNKTFDLHSVNSLAAYNEYKHWHIQYRCCYQCYAPDFLVPMCAAVPGRCQQPNEMGCQSMIFKCKPMLTIKLPGSVLVQTRRSVQLRNNAKNGNFFSITEWMEYPKESSLRPTGWIPEITIQLRSVGNRTQCFVSSICPL
jgi:hypothetical protein